MLSDALSACSPANESLICSLSVAVIRGQGLPEEFHCYEGDRPKTEQTMLSCPQHGSHVENRRRYQRIIMFSSTGCQSCYSQWIWQFIRLKCLDTTIWSNEIWRLHKLHKLPQNYGACMNFAQAELWRLHKPHRLPQNYGACINSTNSRIIIT